METRDLTDLVSRGLIVKVGPAGKGTKYVSPLRGLTRAQRTPKGLTNVRAVFLRYKESSYL
jgi:hypothetical protein